MQLSKFQIVLITTGILLISGYLVFSVVLFQGKRNQIICNNLEIVLSDSDKVQLIDEKEISGILLRAELNPIGKVFKAVQSEKIEEELRKNLMIKRVECYKTPSGTVRLTIQQRTPKFMVAGQESYYVDSERATMPVSINYAAYVPVVTGRVARSFATGDLYDFIGFIENDAFWSAQIDQIHIRNDFKIELVPRVGDAIILLGSIDDYESKLDKLYKLYTHGFNVMGWNRYKTIDLQFKNQIVCTKADH